MRGTRARGHERDRQIVEDRSLKPIAVKRFTLSHGSISIRLDTDEVWVCGEPAQEVRGILFRLLRYMMLNPERLISRSDLQTNVWGAQVAEKTIESHLSRLRTALRSAAPLIVTTRSGCELRDAAVDSAREARTRRPSQALENAMAEADPSCRKYNPRERSLPLVSACAVKGGRR